MLERIIKATLSHAKFVAIAAVLLVVIGIWSYLTISVDAFPDVTNTQVEIISRAEGLAAVELERTVTVPLENAMRGIPGVRSLRSVSKYGISIITVVFKDDVKPLTSRQLIFERLMIAREELPEGVATELSPMATVMGEIFQYSLSASLPDDEQAARERLTELRGIQDWVVAPRLKGVPGVSEINSYGGYLKEYQVIVNPDMLVKFGIGISDVSKALEANNRIVAGGIIERFGTKAVIRGIGQFRSLEDIENTPVAHRNGIPVTVRDVAGVGAGQAVRQGAAISDGAESVGGIVMMLRGENGRDVVERVKKAVAEINAGNLLPDGVKLVPYYDRSLMVNASINTVTRALVEGAIFIVIILVLFLRSLRSTVIVLLTLPLNLLSTFIVMRIFGLEANLMSLGGMVISLGMIVDATVIQIENIQRHLAAHDLGRSLKDTIAAAIMEVRRPSLFGEIIIASTFLPLAAFQGIEGRMFIPLALTVVTVLAVSLLLSILVVPALAFLIIPGDKHAANPMFDLISRTYSRLLHRALHRRKAVIAAAGAVVIAAVALIPTLGSEFIPIMDEGAFDMDVTLHPSVSLDQAVDVNKKVTQVFRDFPEIVSAVGRIGQTGVALDVRGVDRTGYVGILAPRSKWTNARNREDLVEKFRLALSEIPGISFGFSQPIQCRIDEIVAGTRAQLAVRISGDDLDVLADMAKKIGAVLGSIPGAADLAVERSEGQRYLTITPDRAALARYNLSVADIQETVEHALGGVTATKVYEGERAFDLVVRGPAEIRQSLEAVSRFLVAAPQGQRVPLGEVARVAWEEGAMQVSRENGQRRMGIELNVTGRDVGGFVAEAQKAVKKSVSIPKGYVLSWGGQFESQTRAMRTMALIVPVVIVLVATLLFLTFRSWRLTGIIFMNIPFSLAGGFIALKISGIYLSVPASIGFIVLFGIAVLNGMVLISYLQQLHERGKDSMQAVSEGSVSRLRPVLMTAFIAMASLIPLLLSHGTGSEIQRPLATVVIGGLLTATIGTLFLLPIYYTLAVKKRQSIRP